MILLTNSGDDGGAEGADGAHRRAPDPVAVATKRQQREVFARPSDRLRALLEAEGWPSAERVGPEAARGAWLIAQHADTQLDGLRTPILPGPSPPGEACSAEAAESFA